MAGFIRLFTFFKKIIGPADYRCTHLRFRSIRLRFQNCHGNSPKKRHNPVSSLHLTPPWAQFGLIDHINAILTSIIQTARPTLSCHTIDSFLGCRHNAGSLGQQTDHSRKRDLLYIVLQTFPLISLPGSEGISIAIPVSVYFTRLGIGLKEKINFLTASFFIGQGKPSGSGRSVGMRTSFYLIPA